MFQHEGMDDGDGNHVLQALEGPNHEGPAGPGTGKRDVEMVTIGFCLKTCLSCRTCRAVCCYPVAKLGLGPHKTAACLLGIIPLVYPLAIH